jgi:methylase of polypeptide subunit release factors
LRLAPNYLASQGMIICEIGKGQGAQLKKIVSKYFVDNRCKIINDFAGFDRIAIIISN